MQDVIPAFLGCPDGDRRVDNRQPWPIHADIGLDPADKVLRVWECNVQNLHTIHLLWLDVSDLHVVNL